MQTRRYAVFGLLDDATARAVRPLQQRLSAATGNDLAQRFPVHITLRGRFRCTPDVVTQVWDELRLRHDRQHHIVLSGPVFRVPDLLWLEASPESTGYADLVRWHGELTRALKVTEDETSPAHTGEGYRPHVTLGWGASEQLLDGPIEPFPLNLTTTVTTIVLAEYPATWPASGVVQPIRRLRPVSWTSEAQTPGTSS